MKFCRLKPRLFLIPDVINILRSLEWSVNHKPAGSYGLKSQQEFLEVSDASLSLINYSIRLHSNRFPTICLQIILRDLYTLDNYSNTCCRQFRSIPAVNRKQHLHFDWKVHAPFVTQSASGIYYYLRVVSCPLTRRQHSLRARSPWSAPGEPRERWAPLAIRPYMCGKTQWENPVGKPSGKTQWENPVGKPSGKTQWENPVGKPSGKPSGKTQWENPVGKPSGKTQWENPVGKPSGKTQWKNPVGKPSGKTQWENHTQKGCPAVVSKPPPAGWKRDTLTTRP